MPDKEIQSSFSPPDARSWLEYSWKIQQETQAYKLALETNNAMGLYQVGKFFGQVLAAHGQKQEGLAVLQRAYDIGKSAGLSGYEQIGEMIKQLQ